MTARRIVRIGSVVFLVSFLISAAPADVLWNQDPINSFGGLSSQDARNPGGLGWFSEVAENFTAAAGWKIGEVDFNGGYAMPVGQEGHTQGFTIRFYTDSNNYPGTRIYEQDVWTFTEVLYYTHPTLGYAGYRYTVVLPSPFAFTTAGQYWVSVVAILDRGGTANEPQWGWIQATNIIPPRAHQWFFSPGNFYETSNDVALTLLGTVGLRGDLNCDGVINAFDIDPFVLALTNPTAYQQQYPNCNIMNGDINGDGVVNAFDIDPFVVCITLGACP